MKRFMLGVAALALMLVAIALMVLAELETFLGHPRANRHRSADESRAASRAALLRVAVGEGHAFSSDSINIRSSVAHHAAVVVADVPGADIVTPDD